MKFDDQVEPSISVKEFAKRIKKSRQSVYKMLSNKLQPYVMKIDGKTEIMTCALSLFNDCQPVDNKLTISLQQQLAEKDEQIKKLHQLLDQEQRLHLIAENKILELQATKKPWYKRLFNGL